MCYRSYMFLCRVIGSQKMLLWVSHQPALLPWSFPGTQFRLSRFGRRGRQFKSAWKQNRSTTAVSTGERASPSAKRAHVVQLVACRVLVMRRTITLIWMHFRGQLLDFNAPHSCRSKLNFLLIETTHTHPSTILPSEMDARRMPGACRTMPPPILHATGASAWLTRAIAYHTWYVSWDRMS